MCSYGSNSFNPSNFSVICGIGKDGLQLYNVPTRVDQVSVGKRTELREEQQKPAEANTLPQANHSYSLLHQLAHEERSSKKAAPHHLQQLLGDSDKGGDDKIQADRQ